jgi:hypothetical protein
MENAILNKENDDLLHESFDRITEFCLRAVARD